MDGVKGAEKLEEVAAELRLGLGPKPGAPALDLVSCSPGQQLEERRERVGGEVAGEDSAETSQENFN